jgi:hypothetical protein
MKNKLVLLLCVLSNLVSGQNAIQFNGTNAYVAFGNNTNLGLFQFTLECWFKRSGSGTTTSTGSGGVTAVPLISKGRGEADGSNLDMNYFLGIRQTDSTLVADFEEGAAGTIPGLNHPIAGVTKLARNTWYHVAVTYNGSVWKLYLNGQLENQLSVNQPVQGVSIQHAAIGSACTSVGAAQGFFNGIIDEVRIWNAARTQTQVISTLNSAITGTSTNLIARWGFNEGTGTSVASSAGTTITGTVTGTNWSWVTQQAPFNINIAPLIPVLVAPADSSKCNTSSTKLSVNVTDPNGDSLWVKFYGRIKSNKKDFSIIPLPDTQYYTAQINGATNALYKSQMNWVVAKKDSLNIKFISGLGDCVENGDNGGNDVEWKRADTAMKIIETATTVAFTNGIPYGLNVGNHDQSPGGNPNGTTTFYNQYFGTSRFSGRAYWGGNFGSNADNNYQLFTAEGIDFLVINLEYDVAASSTVLAWAAGLVQTYSTRKVIVASHWLVNLDGSFSAQGLATYNALKAYPNFFLMLCGHVAGEARRTDVFNGNVVHSLMSDYQGRTNGGNGWIRVVKLRPSIGKINVSTYSPALNLSETDADSQFALDYEFGPAYTLIDSVKVASGQIANKNWNNLLPATEYQWYAKVSDGNTALNGQTYQFKTNAYKIRLPNDTSLCSAPLTVTLASGSCTGCTTFTWMNGSNSSSISVNSSSQVIASISDSLNCLTRDTMNVNFLTVPLQPAVINGNLNPCTNSLNTYSVTSVVGVSSYTWAIPSGWTGISSTNTLALTSGTLNGIISVIGGNICGVSPSRTVQVNVNAPPLAPTAISGNSIICFSALPNSYSVAAVAGATTYTWNLPAIASGTSSSNTIQLALTTGVGNVSVAATNSCGTGAFQTLSVTVNALPVITITNLSNTICLGNSLTYSWSNLATTTSISVSPSLTTNYSVSGTNTNGCINSNNVSLTVIPLPTITISGNSAICVGNTLSLSGGGATTYTWSNASNAASVVISPTSNTTYSVIGTSVNGCANFTTKTITVNSLPTVVINGNNSICIGNTLVLNAAGAATYTWNVLANTVSISVSPTINSSYNLLGTDLNGCINSALKNVTVNPLPVIVIAGNTAVCYGNTLILNASGALTYTWNTFANTPLVSLTPSVNSVFSVSGTDQNGCQNSASKSVLVNPLPIVSISSTTNTICYGNTLVVIASGANTYTWNTQSVSPFISVSPLLSTNYTVTGEDLNGCLAISIYNVIVNQLPILTITPSSTLLCLGESMNLTASGANTYTWSNFQTGAVIPISPNTSTSYTVSGTDTNGCLNKTSFTQSVNACTGLKNLGKQTLELNVYPNPGSGVFNFEGNFELDSQLLITNTLGEILMTTKLIDGLNTIKLEANKGIYFYTIHSSENKTEKGKLIIH